MTPGIMEWTSMRTPAILGVAAAFNLASKQRSVEYLNAFARVLTVAASIFAR